MAMKSADLTAINTQLALLSGFSPLSVADVEHYLNSPDQFALALPKETGKGYLYGLELVQLRRDLFNKRTLQHRCEVFRSKLSYGGLGEGLAVWLDTKACRLEDLSDCIDIGMGHSVYRLLFSSGYSCVVKACDENYMAFYAEILAVFNLPFIETVECRYEGGLWQFSDYVEGEHVSQCLLHDRVTDDIVIQLAQQACLGDVLGRGDRHLENYLLVGEAVYPLDMTYMFWPDNEDWVDRYIKGGQSECCLIQFYPKYEDLFWSSYTQMYEGIRQSLPALKQVIQTFFNGDSYETACAFVDERLHAKEYVSQRRSQSKQALDVYAQRWTYKKALSDYVEQRLVKDLDPLLWMYYYANKDRLTAFFLIEYMQRDYLFDVLKD
ncbi:hypothetical protein OAJ27_01445 [bacterium]|nr:hypothetical protein [bacterium]